MADIVKIVRIIEAVGLPLPARQDLALRTIDQKTQAATRDDLHLRTSVQKI